MIDTKAFLHDAKTALVVIDLQRGIAGRQVAPHDGSAVVANAAKVAEAFRRAELPVVLVRVSPTPATALQPLVDEAPQWGAPQPGWDEIVPELGRSEGDVVVTKQQWGAFYGTDLDLQLRRRGVERIAICGISTNIGVESTARDAFERNYKILFIEDAMAALNADEHMHSVERIFPRMGIVRSTAGVLTAMRA